MKHHSMIAVFAIYSALAQVPSGSVVVVNFGEDKIVIAADSRMVSSGSWFTKPPDDTFCKIATLGDKLVFASVRDVGRNNPTNYDLVGNWNNIKIAREVWAAHPRNDKTAEAWLQEVAEDWGEIVAKHWRWDFLFNHAEVVDAAARENGVFTIAMFITMDGGTVHMRTVLIAFTPNKPVPIDKVIGNGLGAGLCWTCGKNNPRACALGELGIVEEFCKGTTERSKIEPWIIDSPLPPTAGEDARRTVRLVELTAKYVPAVVGGKVDVLELDKTESIRWLTVKSNCREDNN